MEQEVEDGGEGGLDVFGADVFVGMVREAAGGAEKEHGGGDGGGENHGVVAGAGEDGFGVVAGSGCGLVKVVGEVAVHGDGVLLGLDDGVDLDTAESTGGLGLGEQVGDGGVARLVFGMADVERCVDGAGDDVDGSRQRGDAADGGDELGVVGGVVLDVDDPLGGSGEGVAAQGHGGGAGVVGLALEGEFKPRLADDG